LTRRDGAFRPEAPSASPFQPCRPARRSLFGGYEVGIGFSGTYSNDGAVAEATALAGKRSIRFSAVLKKLAEG